MASRTKDDVPFLERGRDLGEPPPTPLEMLRTIGLALSGLVFMISVIVFFVVVLR